MGSIPVIDVFAGPGGLNEGFSSLRDDRGQAVFKTVASFEMDSDAHSTLVLRTALRHTWEQHGHFPDEYYRLLHGQTTFPELAQHPSMVAALHLATSEVHRVTLGPATRSESDDLIRRALNATRAVDGPWVLIGGPPCQAYSMAGRSRRRGDPTFADDEKHLLYREYLHIIREFLPPVFVMENVKGMLSSQHAGGGIFTRILEDLRGPSGATGYDIHSFVTAGSEDDLRPADFIIRSENHGVPQRRHRVILLGVRRGLGLRPPEQLLTSPPVTTGAAIGDLPSIRSLLSPRSRDSAETWEECRVRALTMARGRPVATRRPPRLGARFMSSAPSKMAVGPLRKWIVDERLEGVTMHESRPHMPTDLMRYAFLAQKTRSGGRSPRLSDLPAALMPNHRNATAENAPFNDRFRVQDRDNPSSTVVSHIAKDGNYYIHPDPNQMRSLSVREAARLQTFPDNYLFLGTRTQQYRQVGNAVPPLLARSLAKVITRLISAD